MRGIPDAAILISANILVLMRKELERSDRNNKDKNQKNKQ